MLIQTGIAKLDELLKGGILHNKSVLFKSVPGVENLQFAHQLLYTHLQSGGGAVYFVNNKKPSAVKFMLKNFDWNIEPYEKKGLFSFIDSYSGLTSQSFEGSIAINDPCDLEEIDQKLADTLKKLDNKSIVSIFDSLSVLIDQCDLKELFLYLKRWVSTAEKYGATPIFLFTEWAYDKKLVDKLVGLFDYVIDLKAIERKVILRNYFTVSKGDGAKREIPFKIVKPGGVKVFIPKLLVTGPFNAGKTSFIHSASTKAVSVDRLGTTVALDHGHVDYKGFAVDLFGTPGQERFDPILEMLGSEALGVVVLVDSTDSKGFGRAKDMLSVTKTGGLPSVVVANKANLKGALNPEEIRKKMNLPEEIPIVPVVAEDLTKVKKGEPCKLKKEDLNKVLDKLFEVVV